MRRAVIALLVGLVGCSTVDATRDDTPTFGPRGKTDDPRPASPYSNWQRDVRRTELRVDLAALQGEARITLGPSTRGGVSLEAPGLTIGAVEGPRGGTLRFEHRDGVLHVDAPEVESTTDIVVRYAFRTQDASNGWLASGSTVLWPYFCGNLFPCRTSPYDGSTYSLTVTGVPDGSTALFASGIETDAPAYMLAFAVGDYECEALGATSAGTRVKTCWLPRGRTAAIEGTRNLVEVFDWLETTIGPYAYGDEVGAIAVSWGESAAGGMEHHPFWHVDVSSMRSEETQAHEAAHGWFGDGVRIKCWEDFVLSEGTVTYLAARALGVVAGAAAEATIWDEHSAELDDAIESEDTLVLPASCGEVDLLDDGLFSNVVYMKGAFFFRAVGEAVGRDVLDRVLSGFYQRNVGKAARMQELLDAIALETGFDPEPLADAWLRTRGARPDR